MMSRFTVLACVALLPAVASPAAEAAKPAVASGWGVDALLSYAIEEKEVPAYLELLKNSGVKVVRERHTGGYAFGGKGRDVRVTYDLTRAAGIGVASFAGMSRDRGRTAWGALPPDLRDVWEDGRRLGRAFAGHVDVWELQNEPELAWWSDMPDLYVAHHKALYMGLKAGAREAGKDTPVLFCSLGLPAGPWVERAARNGIMPYADAWNVHYYGEASQFTGMIEGHVAAMRELGEPEPGEAFPPSGRWPVKRRVRSAGETRATALAGRVLPIWATEVGIKSVMPDTWGDPGRRARQAEFIVSTARQALARPEMAAFMPFVLVHKDDGYAMTEGADRTWPAWDEYARFTRENPWPSRPAVAPPHAVNPVVLQWLADAETATGHKAAAAYRWLSDGAPIRGELRVYNLGAEPVRGRLRATRGEEGGASVVACRPPSDDWLAVPAGGMLALPLELTPGDASADGRREWRQYSFEERSGRRSELGFAVERSPDLYPPEWRGLAPAPWGDASPCVRYLPNATPGEGRGDWRVFNGLRVVATSGALARFELGSRPDDPEHPPLAAMRLPEGLPPRGWLRVAMRELGTAGVRARVDLVDGEGRRFTIWENLGRAAGVPLDAPRWMALQDFHPYAWGKLDTRRRLAPAEVREIQLRFYAFKGPAMADVELGFAENPGLIPAAPALAAPESSSAGAGAPVE